MKKITVKVNSSEDAEVCDSALHELCVSFSEDYEETMKKARLPDAVKKRLPDFMAMCYDKQEDGTFVVYFPVDLPFGLNVLMWQGFRKFRKTIREYLKAKGINAEVK